MYSVLRSLFFSLPPEMAHQVALGSLALLQRLHLTQHFFSPVPDRPVEVAGLSFRNPVGIAAGLDKNGDYIEALASLGVGFIELGAVTPRPQIGNPKPRLFRLPDHKAIINRMGFNNKGLDYLVARLGNLRDRRCIIGVNLGKNKDTPLAEAHRDYSTCLEKLYPYADFMTINISSPNTPELRSLQNPHYFGDLLKSVREVRDRLGAQTQRPMPLWVKISPDVSREEVEEMVNTVKQVGLEGIIATNTTQSRVAVADAPQANEAGGLSGVPLKSASYEVLNWIRAVDPTLPVISVGGIDSQTEAKRRFEAGAQLIQVYTGLIYEGPSLLRRLID